MKPAQKIMLAGLLLLFAAAKVAMLLWWQSRQPEVQTLSCNPAAEGCRFGAGAQLKLIGVGRHDQAFAVAAAGLPSDTQTVSLSFSMRGMDMGFNRFDLQHQGQGVWRGEGLRLPVCSLSRRDWIAEWTVDGKRYQADFQTQ